MSYYVKRISVLKQIGTGFSMNGKALSGLAKIEKTGLNEQITISLINLAPVSEGKYYACFKGTDNQFSYLELGSHPLNFTQALSSPIEIEEGFSCLICFAVNNKVTNIAFGTSGIVNTDVEEMKNNVLKKINTARPEPKQPEPTPNDIVNEEIQTSVCSKEKEDEFQNNFGKLETDTYNNKEYQDEIVATDNYYLYKDVDIENLSIKEDENQDKKIIQEVFSEKKEPKPQEQTGTIGDLFKDPKTFDFDGVIKGNYFDKVKDELDMIFSKNPKEEALEKNIPYSKWAKIYYSEEKYYTVGLIYDEKKPAYICYGVPGKYSKEPPKELKGYCSYLPLSLFDLGGDGYWMMYQNADSGECVHIDLI